MRTAVHVRDGKQTDDENRMHAQHLWLYRYAAQLIPPNLPVVDLGCGHGDGSPLLANGTRIVYALEPDPEILRVARARHTNIPTVIYCAGDHRNLPGGCAVVCFEVIEHIRDDLTFLRHLRGHGQPVLLSTPDRRFRLHASHKPWNPEHIREYAPAELHQVFIMAGFAHVNISGVYAQPEVMNAERKRVRRAEFLYAHDFLNLRRLIPYHRRYPVERFVRKLLGWGIEPALPTPEYELRPPDEPCLQLFVEARP